MTFLALMVDGHWVHDLSKFVPFLHYREQFGVRYYGLAYVLGFLGAAWLMIRYARAGRSLVPARDVMDLLFALMLGVFIGGRLGWLFLYRPDIITEDPLSILAIWQGGMASHGGFVGVALASLWFAKRSRIPVLHVGDLVVSAVPLGLMLGRIANFINGELWGKVSNVRWAVIFPESADPGTPLTEIAARHPSQLYQAALEGGLLLAYMQWRFWKSSAALLNPGRLGGEFLIGYAILRSVGEQFREPDAGLLFGLSRGTFYSLFLIVAGIVLLLIARRSPPLPPAQLQDAAGSSAKPA